MNILTDTISPTMDEVIDCITKKISLVIYEYNINHANEVVTSHTVGTRNNDSYSLSVSIALSDDLSNERSLNFFVIQNTNNADVCIIITSCEKEGLRILFKSINKYPIVGIEKYLPNIINSTIAKLQ